MNYVEQKCAEYEGTERVYPPERDQDDEDPLEDAVQIKVKIAGVGTVTPPSKDDDCG